MLADKKTFSQRERGRGGGNREPIRPRPATISRGGRFFQSHFRLCGSEAQNISRFLTWYFAVRVPFARAIYISRASGQRRLFCPLAGAFKRS